MPRRRARSSACSRRRCTATIRRYWKSASASKDGGTPLTVSGVLCARRVVVRGGLRGGVFGCGLDGHGDRVLRPAGRAQRRGHVHDVAQVHVGHAGNDLAIDRDGGRGVDAVKDELATPAGGGAPLARRGKRPAVGERVRRGVGKDLQKD